jgi:hypothetical protein
MDTLEGLKENVIVGHLIPAGTGLPKFRELIVMPKEQFKTTTGGDGWMGSDQALELDRSIRRERVHA